MGSTRREADARQLGGEEPFGSRVGTPVAADGHPRALPKVAPFGRTWPVPCTQGAGSMGH